MSFFARADRYAQRLWLSAVCATDYPEQEPGYKRVRWYHLLLLLIPIAGIVGFMLAGESTHAERRDLAR